MFNLKVRSLTVAKQDGVLMAGFSDDAAAPANWLILQRTLNPDEQDVQLGQDQVHLELNSQRRSCYGGVERVEFDPDKIVFSLAPSKATRLKVDGGIMLDMTDAKFDAAALVEALNALLAPLRIQAVLP